MGTLTSPPPGNGSTPAWEWIKRHDGWFELVWIFSDWGNGAILFVQDAQGVNPRLLDLCNEWAGDNNA
jgi:hypothetical protein